MILYHYSVDSYRGGDTLLNDYNGLYRFAEPFLLALERSEDCFWSTYFSAMAYTRELCALQLRKHENYVKDAVEAAFEFVRKRDFGDCSVSRIGCVYYCESREAALACLAKDCLDNGDYTVEKVKLLEVDVAEDSIHRYDQSWFNRAEKIMETERDLEKVLALAADYFSHALSEEAIVEILSAGRNRIIRQIPI